MAITRLGGANAISGTIPQGNIANASLGAVTALPAGVGGKVLNSYTDVNGASETTTSTSFVISGNSITLTPVSSSSKFLLIFNAVLEVTNGGRPEFTFFRNSTNIGTGANASIVRDQDTSNINVSYGMHKLDSPNTASQIIYSMYYRSDNGNTLNANSGGEANLTILEIGT